MTEYKIGDKVRIVKDFETWSEGEFPAESILTVVETNHHSEYTIDRENLTLEIEALEDYPEDFEPVVNAPFGGFVSASTTGLIGEAGCESIVPIARNTNGMVTLDQTVHTEPGRFGSFHGGAVLDLPKEVERTLLQGYKDALIKSHEERDPEVLGVYRPDVENRKVDKIRIELFDDGFPNAILEIAKVLTWAQKVKGYKDHDWVNLPDAENSLKGAASRHRRDANQQKMEGVPAKDRVDHESKHHHLAHQAFNILAELELILTGKIT